MPMGNNLFQVPVQRRAVKRTASGNNLYSSSSSKVSNQRKRGLSGLGQDDSLDLLPVDTSDLTDLTDLTSDNTDLLNSPDVSLSLSYPGTSDTSSENPFALPSDSFYEPGIEAGMISSSDILPSSTDTGSEIQQILAQVPQDAGALATLGASASTTGAYSNYGYTYPTTNPSWLSQQSIASGVPNWVFLAGAGVLVVAVVAGGKRRR